MPLLIPILFVLMIFLQIIACITLLIKLFKKESVLKGILGLVLVGIFILLAGFQPVLKTGWVSVAMSQPPQRPAAKPVSKTPSSQPNPPVEKKAVQPRISQQEIANKINRLNQIIAQDKENADAFYSRGWLYEYQGDLQKAERDYTSAIGINKQHADAYYNRGLVYIKMNRLDEAVKEFSNVLTFRPQSVDAYCNRGNAYYKSGDLDRAVSDFSEAIKLDSKDADLFYNRGIVYRAKGEHAKAEIDLQQAVTLGHKAAKNYLQNFVEERKISTPPPPDQRTAKEPQKKPVEKPKVSPPPEKSDQEAGKRIVKKPIERAKIPAPPTPLSRVVWNMDLHEAIIPEEPVLGKIHGESFTMDSAKIQGGILTLSKGKDFAPEQSTLIFLFLKTGERLEGKQYNISRDQGKGVPHIHIKWRAVGKEGLETEMFMRDYAMHLEFGEVENGKVPGKIYLSLPDKMQSFLAGTFVADIK